VHLALPAVGGEVAEMDQDPITVVLVDDHRMFRAGVRASLDDAFDVVGEAEDVEGAIRAVRTLRPSVVLLDVHLPGGCGGGGAEVIAAVPTCWARPVSSPCRCPTRPTTSSR